MPVIMFGFFMLQSGLISKHSTEEDES